MRAGGDLSMQITVQLRADVARLIAARQPLTAEAAALTQTLSPFGATLEPLHPHTDDAELQTQFWINVPDQVAAERIVQRLNQLNAVQAAYLKPPDELP